MLVYSLLVLGFIAGAELAALSKRVDDHGTCDVDYFEKQDCSQGSISENECLELGCCYQETHLANIPWCYRPYDESGGVDITEAPTYTHLGLTHDDLSGYDMSWVPDSDGSVPDHAVYVRDDGGTKYYIVLVEHEGSFYPGKLGGKHDVAHYAVKGEGELRSRTYEVLQQLPSSPLRLTWIEPTWQGPGDHWVPQNVFNSYAVVGSLNHPLPEGNYYHSNPLFVAIGETPEGYHPGYVGFSDHQATIPWGGSALQAGDFFNTPAPGAIKDVGFAVLIAIPEDILPSITPPSPELMQPALVE